MVYDPEHHHHRSIRLQGYDYAQAGAYFITICTQDRACLFGEVVDGVMRLNDAGRIVQATWDDVPEHYANVALDEFVVMPNHVHGIVVIRTPITPLTSVTFVTPVGAGLVPAPGATTRVAPTCNANHAGANHAGANHAGANHAGANHAGANHAGANHAGANHAGAIIRVAPSLGDVVGGFKSRATVAYAHGVKTNEWPPFHLRLWQRNYYERIIRDDKSLHRIRQYICDNPSRWAFNRDNPTVTWPEPEAAP
jgi:REP element-mobilizing transposase RayT